MADQELTPRERQIAELLAWGSSAKEVPALLVRKYGGAEISANTVRNIVANIFTKLNISKVSELSAWWFCTVEGVDSSHSPFKRVLRQRFYSIICLAVLLPQIASIDQAIRTSRTRAPRPVRTERVERGRRRE